MGGISVPFKRSRIDPKEQPELIIIILEEFKGVVQNPPKFYKLFK